MLQLLATIVAKKYLSFEVCTDDYFANYVIREKRRNLAYFLNQIIKYSRTEFEGNKISVRDIAYDATKIKKLRELWISGGQQRRRMSRMEMKES